MDFGFQLDVGDISEALDEEVRRKQFEKLYSSYFNVENETEKVFKRQRNDFDDLMFAAKKGEPIRIWKGNSPHSACGFAFLCYALQSIDCEMSLISLPQFVFRSRIFRRGR